MSPASSNTVTTRRQPARVLVVRQRRQDARTEPVADKPRDPSTRGVSAMYGEQVAASVYLHLYGPGSLYLPPSRVDELSEPFGNSVHQTRSP